MNGIATRSIGVAALAGAAVLVACTGDIETIPPLDFYSQAGRSASNGDGAGGATSLGSTGGTGSVTMPGTGGSGAGTGTGGAGGSLASGATGGTGVGGMKSGAGTGGAPGAGGAVAGAGTGGMGASSGGLASGGAAGASAGSSGRGGSGFGGRAGAGTGGVSTAGGTAAGAGGAAGGGGAAFAPIAAFFQETCAAADCHGGKERPSLTSANPSTLYNTIKSTAVRQCGSDRLVTANDPANSAVLELVQQQCGMFVMPEDCKTNPCISADDLAMLTEWIQAGAPGP